MSLRFVHRLFSMNDLKVKYSTDSIITFIIIITLLNINIHPIWLPNANKLCKYHISIVVVFTKGAVFILHLFVHSYLNFVFFESNKLIPLTWGKLRCILDAYEPSFYEWQYIDSLGSMYVVCQDLEPHQLSRKHLILNGISQYTQGENYSLGIDPDMWWMMFILSPFFLICFIACTSVCSENAESVDNLYSHHYTVFITVLSIRIIRASIGIKHDILNAMIGSDSLLLYNNIGIFIAINI